MLVVGAHTSDITPSDSVDVSKDAEGNFPDAIIASGAGNVSLELINGGIVTVALSAGVERPFSFRKLRATGTTATGVRGLFLK